MIDGLKALTKQVELERNLYSATRTLLGCLFTKQELVSHSGAEPQTQNNSIIHPVFILMQFCVTML